MLFMTGGSLIILAGECWRWFTPVTLTSATCRW
ncbi:hypothetical protein ACFQ2Y_41480 [Streptomyces malaysiensis subsp. malaysiensis]